MARKAKKDNIDEFMDDYFRRVRFESPQKQPEDINNASMDKDANSSTAATGNSMNGNVNGTTYCTPSMYEQMYNNGLLGSFPYAGINPVINNGYLVTKRIFLIIFTLAIAIYRQMILLVIFSVSL